jgi:hypothetical protein
MGMVVRTGRIVGLSAAWLAMMAATGLAQNHTAPEVARKLGKFLLRRHRLIKVGQEIAYRWAFSHGSLLQDEYTMIKVTASRYIIDSVSLELARSAAKAIDKPE